MEIKVNFFDVKSQCSVTRSFKDFSNSSQTGKLADHGVNWLSLNLGRLLHAVTFGERYLHVSRRDKPFSSITWRHWMMPMFVYWWREGFINATWRFDLKPQDKLNKWGVTGILQLTRGSSPFETANHNSKTFLRAYVCHPRTFWKKIQTLQTENAQIKTILQDRTSKISRSVGVFPDTTILKNWAHSQPLPIVLL